MSVPAEAEQQARVRSVTLTLDGPAEPGSPSAAAIWLLKRVDTHLGSVQLTDALVARWRHGLRDLIPYTGDRTTAQQDEVLDQLLHVLIEDFRMEASTTLCNRMATDLAAVFIPHLTKKESRR